MVDRELLAVVAGPVDLAHCVAPQLEGPVARRCDGERLAHVDRVDVCAVGCACRVGGDELLGLQRLAGLWGLRGDPVLTMAADCWFIGGKVFLFSL